MSDGLQFFSRLAPTLIFGLSVISSLMYVPVADWRHVVYWAAAAAITWSVTY